MGHKVHSICYQCPEKSVKAIPNILLTVVKVRDLADLIEYLKQVRKLIFKLQ